MGPNAIGSSMEFLERMFRISLRTNTNHDIITYIEFLSPTMHISNKFLILIT